MCVCPVCRYEDEDHPEVPLLFRDVPSLLIIFVLTMPQPLRKGTVFNVRASVSVGKAHHYNMTDWTIRVNNVHFDLAERLNTFVELSFALFQSLYLSGFPSSVHLSVATDLRKKANEISFSIARIF